MRAQDELRYWVNATVPGWCPCKDGHPELCQPEDHPGSDHKDERDQPCGCGHRRGDHRANSGVCLERDRSAPCGCRTFHAREGRQGW